MRKEHESKEERKQKGERELVKKREREAREESKPNCSKPTPPPRQLVDYPPLIHLIRDTSIQLFATSFERNLPTPHPDRLKNLGGEERLLPFSRSVDSLALVTGSLLLSSLSLSLSGESLTDLSLGVYDHGKEDGR